MYNKTLENKPLSTQRSDSVATPSDAQFLPSVDSTVVQRARLDPRSLTPQNIRAVQRSCGNQAAVRLIQPQAGVQPVQQKPGAVSEPVIQRMKNDEEGQSDKKAGKGSSGGFNLGQFLIMLFTLFGLLGRLLNSIRQVIGSSSNSGKDAEVKKKLSEEIRPQLTGLSEIKPSVGLSPSSQGLQNGGELRQRSVTLSTGMEGLALSLPGSGDGELIHQEVSGIKKELESPSKPTMQGVQDGGQVRQEVQTLIQEVDQITTSTSSPQQESETQKSSQKVEPPTQETKKYVPPFKRGGNNAPQQQPPQQQSPEFQRIQRVLESGNIGFRRYYYHNRPFTVGSNKVPTVRYEASGDGTSVVLDIHAFTGEPSYGPGGLWIPGIKDFSLNADSVKGGELVKGLYEQWKKWKDQNSDEDQDVREYLQREKRENDEKWGGLRKKQ